jgi:hypothetical protein
VVANINLLPVVKASPFEMFIIYFETKGMDQVQPYFRSSAETGNVPGIGRYFGLVEDDMKMGGLNNALVYFRYIARHCFS